MPPPGTTIAGRDVALGALAIVLRELPSVDDAGPGISIWEGSDGGEGWRTNHWLRRALELHRSSGTGGETVGPPLHAHGNDESTSFSNRVGLTMRIRGSLVCRKDSR